MTSLDTLSGGRNRDTITEIGRNRSVANVSFVTFFGDNRIFIKSALWVKSGGNTRATPSFPFVPEKKRVTPVIFPDIQVIPKPKWSAKKRLPPLFCSFSQLFSPMASYLGALCVLDQKIQTIPEGEIAPLEAIGQTDHFFYWKEGKKQKGHHPA